MRPSRRGTSTTLILTATLLAAAGAWNNANTFETILFLTITALLLAALWTYPREKQ